MYFSLERNIRPGLEMEIVERQTQTATYDPNNPQMSFIIRKRIRPKSRPLLLGGARSRRLLSTLVYVRVYVALYVYTLVLNCHVYVPTHLFSFLLQFCNIIRLFRMCVCVSIFPSIDEYKI